MSDFCDFCEEAHANKTECECGNDFTEESTAADDSEHFCDLCEEAHANKTECECGNDFSGSHF